MKVLITGMSGFIANNLFQYFNEKHREDVECFGFDLAHNQDLRDYEAVEKAVTGVDLVINLASLTHVDSSIKNPKPFLETITEKPKFSRRSFKYSQKSELESIINIFQFCWII